MAALPGSLQASISVREGERSGMAFSSNRGHTGECWCAEDVIHGLLHASCGEGGQNMKPGDLNFGCGYAVLQKCLFSYNKK